MVKPLLVRSHFEPTMEFIYPTTLMFTFLQQMNVCLVSLI